MAEKMLIDASHPEETRVVVVRGNRIEEFDFESQHKKQLRGNIYLAKVTRVEPSLQAAFVDYGGNRHGFLAFSEIHPDYYQIPLADRQALLEEEAEEAKILENDDADVEPTAESSESETEEDVKPKKRRTRRRKPAAKKEDAVAADVEVSDAEAPKSVDESADNPTDDENINSDDPDTIAQNAIESGAEPLAADAETAADGEQSSDAEPQPAENEEPKSSDDKPDTIAAMVETEDEISEPISDEPTSDETEPGEADIAVTDTEISKADVKTPRRTRKKTPKKAPKSTSETDTSTGDDDVKDDDDVEDENIENIGAGADTQDALEEIPMPPRKSRKQYRIQEVIKRRQIILVQIVKEERGNKGAALTTYLSLAGRYSVLMPNTARGGGISRKITNVQDRKRLKEVAHELDVPQGMGVILRTAGASRTKTEIRRDFEYLMRLWENVRELTLNSIAPSLVYEEGSLIKRSVRDLYTKDIGEVIVAGEEGYREAKDFMKMLMPSHAKVVQPYRGARTIFANNGIEAQLDQMMSPQVTLKSGGYLIINQTEALVAVDVNSGRSTRESSIEDTALQTNLEAAEEVARQLRLRDLAGLVVIDFIDMEEKRNNRAVEKRVKECLKSDRARIQVGRISHFGLLEMSRQRIRASVLESTTQTCPHCEGTGHMRSDSSLALHVLRAVEEQLLKSPRNDVNVRTSAANALYILNQKRDTLIELEQRFGVTILINVDASISGQDFNVERGPQSTKKAAANSEQLVSSYGIADAEMNEVVPNVETEVEAKTDDSSDVTDEDAPRKRRRRRRRGGRNNNGSEENNSDTQDDNGASESDANDESAAKDANIGDDDLEDRPKKRRRRGRRGGRKNRDKDLEANETQEVKEASGSEGQQSPIVDSTAEQVVEQETPSSNADVDTTENIVAAEAAAEEKPKKPRRRRKVKSDAAAEALPDAPVEASPQAEKMQDKTEPKVEISASTSSVDANSDDTAPVKQQSRKSRTDIDQIASQPIVTSSSEPAGDKEPKKTGWWRKAFK